MEGDVYQQAVPPDQHPSGGGYGAAHDAEAGT
ncbi:unnamed protein product, partial [Soboliphyme baturini]|uniref:Transcriptional regulator n=1 Tax=Soboliphyme baturini TaxID=241478 RepID=A0A183J862_9BILA